MEEKRGLFQQRKVLLWNKTVLQIQIKEGGLTASSGLFPSGGVLHVNGHCPVNLLMKLWQIPRESRAHWIPK